MKIKLRECVKEDEKEIIEMYKEYMNAELIPGIDRFEGVRKLEDLGEKSFLDWKEEIENEKDQSKLPENFSAQTMYFAIDEEEKIVGVIALRWKEVPILFTFGGFIGYTVRPTERGKGYATQMLNFGLEEFKKINKERVLITCKDFNIPSIKVIEKNGGIYENSYFDETEGYTHLRYWINL